MKESKDVIDLIFGRWKSQILYAGLEIGVFDQLNLEEFRDPEEIADATDTDPQLLYRLMRALAAIGLVTESSSNLFALTVKGHLLQTNHPGSLRYMALLEEGPEHYAIWKHLPAMVRQGRQNGFVREYGCKAFEYAAINQDYGHVFKHAMSSFSSIQSSFVLDALSDYDFSNIGTVCDVAGGHGHLLCSILDRYKYLRGIVFDLPEVVNDLEDLWAEKMQVEKRCRYISGDMFEDVPEADAFFLKMILHDWNDKECRTILTNMRNRTQDQGRVFIVEHIVPGPSEAHFSKLYDIHMMCWGTGRERTEAEYARLLEASGWRFAASHYPSSRTMGIIEGVAV